LGRRPGAAAVNYPFGHDVVGKHSFTMRDDYLQNALKVIDDPTILINVVSRRVKQLRNGHRALVVSLERLSLEDIALREVSEKKITFELGSEDSHGGPTPARTPTRSNLPEIHQSQISSLLT
jgi:DNA-directed RNA polymerase subunit omega